MQSSKPASVAIIALSQVAALSLWFSASAVVPSLVAEFGLSNFVQAAFTGAVQVGFVIGCLVSALLGLADRIDPRRFFAASAAIGAGANALLLVVDPGSNGALLLRVATGVCMAGVYPVGMKLASTWAKGDMGLMVGLLVGALTLGSASPHLFNAFGGVNWRITLATASVSALAAAILIGFSGLGPNRAPAPRFDPHYVLTAWRELPLRLANFGYLGHMWELYAMWSWILAFWTAIAVARGLGDKVPPFMAFAALAVGGVGCVIAGWMADVVGRTAITIAAMMISGACALAIGPAADGPVLLIGALTLIWGASIVADSAQFSACVTELVPIEYTGTAVTLQTALGFLLTMASIRSVPVWLAHWGWTFAFMPLAVGPALGSLAMWRLRRHPDAVKLARGAR